MLRREVIWIGNISRKVTGEAIPGVGLPCVKV